MNTKFNYMIHNNDVVPYKDINTGERCSVYEVVRVINKPIYLLEHIERLNKSLRLLGVEDSTDVNNISRHIEALSKLNNIWINNVKIICVIDDKKISDIYIFHIDSYYPKGEVYRDGVDTIFYSVERENPNIKIHRPELKALINARLNSDNAYEALLIDRDGYVTEGSRSNLLFIKEDSIITTSGDHVLLGVTREKVIEICKKNDIKVLERQITKEEAGEFDAAFLTGTSINVLPIKSIDKTISFDVNNYLLRDIIKLFEEDYNKEEE